MTPRNRGRHRALIAGPGRGGDLPDMDYYPLASAAGSSAGRVPRAGLLDGPARDTQDARRLSAPGAAGSGSWRPTTLAVAAGLAAAALALTLFSRPAR